MYQTMSLGDKWDEGRLEKRRYNGQSQGRRLHNSYIPVKLISAVVKFISAAALTKARNIFSCLSFYFGDIKIMITEEGTTYHIF